MLPHLGTTSGRKVGSSAVQRLQQPAKVKDLHLPACRACCTATRCLPARPSAARPLHHCGRCLCEPAEQGGQHALHLRGCCS